MPRLSGDPGPISAVASPLRNRVYDPDLLLWQTCGLVDRMSSSSNGKGLVELSSGHREAGLVCAETGLPIAWEGCNRLV
jgi:hypothetical protein